MTSEATTIAAWTAAVLGALASVGKAARWMFERRDRLREAEVRRQLAGERDLELASWRAHARLQQHMNEIVAATGCGRLLLIKCANGGGIPGPGATVRVSVEAEAISNLRPTMMHYQNRPMDASYSRLVLAVVDQKETAIRRDDLPEDSTLRVSYEASGVACSLLFKVAIARGAFFFLSLNFAECDDEGQPPHLSAEALETVRTRVELIRSLLGISHQILPKS